MNFLKAGFFSTALQMLASLVLGAEGIGQFQMQVSLN